MKKRKSLKNTFKAYTKVNVDLSTYNVKKDTAKIPAHKLPGIKKGSGGVDGAALAAGATGVSESQASLMQQIIEQIVDITDDPEAIKHVEELRAKDNPEGELGGEEESSTEDVIRRSVPGAHLVFKRQTDIDSFEELWIFRINPTAPTEHSAIEKAILSGTDIPFGSYGSEDGTQIVHYWVAGNAKFMHITGLSN